MLIDLLIFVAHCHIDNVPKTVKVTSMYGKQDVLSKSIFIVNLRRHSIIRIE